MIHFVGAGCGAKDLITVRGMRHIEKADVICYAGSLVNKELLDYNMKNAAIYDSSKMTLEQIINILVESDRAGKYTVRLHTGDPSLYGAIKEQMDELDKADVEYDVTPGVSAAFGAASSLKCEFTLPDVSQTLILTRAEGKTLVPKNQSIRELASHKATMAIYLSAGLSERLKEELLAGGYDKTTPVAICYKVTWDDEKIIKCDIDTMCMELKNNNITKTCIFIVGKVIEPEKYDYSRLYAADFSTEYRKGTSDVF